MARQRAPDYDAKRASIRAAAARLFAEHGFDGSSLNDVARSCGVTKPALYHYFPSKEALLFEILDVHIGLLRQAVLDAEREAGGWEPARRLEHVIARLLAAYRDAGHEYKVQLNELDRLPPAQREQVKEMEREVVRVVAGILVEVNPRLGAAPGLLKPVTMSLFGILNWLYTWFHEDGPVSRPAFAAIATRLFLDGAKALP